MTRSRYPTTAELEDAGGYMTFRDGRWVPGAFFPDGRPIPLGDSAITATAARAEPGAPQPTAKAAAVIAELVANPDPPRLTKEQLDVHREIQAKAAAGSGDWTEALARIAGDPPAHPLRPVPADAAQVDPEEAADFNAALGLAPAWGVAWPDVVAARSMFREHAAARENNPGDPSVPWLNTGILPEPPRPWSDEDFERDKVRAETARVEVPDRRVWQVHAKQGKDYVGELAAQKRSEMLGQQATREVTHLRQARATEDSRRLPQAGAQYSAQIAATGANIMGVVGFLVGSYAALKSVSLETPAGASPIGPQDRLIADAIQNQSYRQSATGVYSETVSDVQRGALPQIGPSAAAIAFVYHPQHGGAANTGLGGGVSVRERFSYGR